MGDRYNVVVCGAGRVAEEFTRLSRGHPLFTVTAVTDAESAGTGADVLIITGDASGLVPRAPTVIDLRDTGPSSDAVLAVPELRPDGLFTAQRLYGPGAIVTAALLALAPLFRAGVPARADVIIDAMLASPLKPGDSLTVSQATGHPAAAVIAAGLGGGPRIHLTLLEYPAPRGLLLSAHLFMADGTSDRDVEAAYRDAYQAEPFIRLQPGRGGRLPGPDPAQLTGSNMCAIGWNLDPFSSRLVVTAALDDLVKGAAGQALQVLNLRSGLEQDTGLTAGRT